ncbi:aminodeoxychorismate lyase [Gilvimarinus polysaccharolyticus]|uniref:aminodeoxychorismate lyase n=1 Tax=Gilvimarinus polysaccharolyticus TaxID=863921 RepID=UPI0006738EA5|nr:aminodeoxychorismate lyase [Gilvimarinus polysaccharolyticus]
MSTPAPPLIWINGKQRHQLSALDRGLAYGDGLFETCRLHDGRLPLWSRHLQRLQTSAAAFGIELNIIQLQAWLDTALAVLDDAAIAHGTVKVIVTRGVGGRGYRPSQSAATTIVLAVFADNLELLTASHVPAHIRVCAMTLGRNRILAGHKHLNRLENVLARAEWQDDATDEGLMLDDCANVIEATAHNIFIYRDGCWHTPALTEAGVAGVMRQLIIDELAPCCNVSVIVAPITLLDVCRADEVLLCNSNRGVRSVASLVDGSGVLHQFSGCQHTQRLAVALSNFLQDKGSY